MFNLIGHSEEPKCIAMQSGLAATGSWDNTLRVWNIYVGMCKYTLVGHSDGVLHVHVRVLCVCMHTYVHKCVCTHV